MAMHRFDWLFYCCTSAKPKPPFLFMTQSAPKRFLICSEADTQLTQASSSVVVVVRLKVDLKSFSLSTRRPALEMEISRSKSLTFPPSTTSTFVLRIFRTTEQTNCPVCLSTANTQMLILLITIPHSLFSLRLASVNTQSINWYQFMVLYMGICTPGYTPTSIQHQTLVTRSSVNRVSERRSYFSEHEFRLTRLDAKYGKHLPFGLLFIPLFIHYHCNPRRRLRLQ